MLNQKQTSNVDILISSEVKDIKFYGLVEELSYTC